MEGRGRNEVTLGGKAEGEMLGKVGHADRRELNLLYWGMKARYKKSN